MTPYVASLGSQRFQLAPYVTLLVFQMYIRFNHNTVHDVAGTNAISRIVRLTRVGFIETYLLFSFIWRETAGLLLEIKMEDSSQSSKRARQCIHNRNNCTHNLKIRLHGISRKWPGTVSSRSPELYRDVARSTRPARSEVDYIYA